MKLFYPIFGVLVLLSYGFVLRGGIVAGASTEKRVMPPEVVGRRGGYRAAPHFWIVGYRGGK